MTESNAHADRLAGSCIVCGKESTMRCSGCSFISLCSTEHHKLMWPIHRLVCRENAHPFRLPPFSQEEADLTYARYTCTATNEKLLEYKGKVHGALGEKVVGDEAFKSTLAALIGTQGTFLAPKKGDPVTTFAERVRRLRCANTAKLKDFPSPPSRQLKLLFQLTAVLDEMSEDGIRPTDPNSEWFSQLCHRVCASCVVTDLYFGSFEAMILKQLDPSRMVSFVTGGRLFPATAKALAAFLADPEDPRDKAFCNAALANSHVKEIIAIADTVESMMGRKLS